MYPDRPVPNESKSEYDQQIPQSHNADQPTAPPQNTGCHKTPGRQLKQSNQLSHPHQHDWKKTDTKY